MAAYFDEAHKLTDQAHELLVLADTLKDSRTKALVMELAAKNLKKAKRAKAGESSIT